MIEHVRALTGVLPTDVAILIGDQLMTAVKSSEGTKGLGILLAFLVATYGGTNGAASVLTALNIAYEEKEKRSLFRFYLLRRLDDAWRSHCRAHRDRCDGGGRLSPAYPSARPAPVAVIAGKIAGYLALALIGALVASVLYRFGPSREDAQWKWITPGSLFAAVAWSLLTIAFGFYVSHFTNYSASYGSLGAVVALLTWLYLSAYAFVFGAELNSEIEHQTAMDSTTGSPEAMGERGAWAADNVATDDTVQDRPEKQREGADLTRAAPKVAKEKG